MVSLKDVMVSYNVKKSSNITKNCSNLSMQFTLSPFSGIIQFTQLVRSLEREDPEIALLHSRVRAHFLPEIPSSSGASL